MSGLDSKTLVAYLYVHTVEEDHLRIECNNCSVGDFVFYDGGEGEQNDTDWIAAAVAHYEERHQT